MGYSPTLGRWMEEDPIAEPRLQEQFTRRPFRPYPDGMNLYEYVDGNPIRYTDPHGLTPNKKDAISYQSLVARAKQLEAKYPGRNACQIVDELNSVYDGYPNYIYTKNEGWIDLNHFFGTAHWVRTPNWIPLAMGWGTEIGQFAWGNTLGWWQDGVGSSAFTFEDLPSNRMGRAFADLLRTECCSGGKKASELLGKFFNALNAAAPEQAPDWKDLPKDEATHERQFREERQGFFEWIWSWGFDED